MDNRQAGNQKEGEALGGGRLPGVRREDSHPEPDPPILPLRVKLVLAALLVPLELVAPP